MIVIEEHQDLLRAHVYAQLTLDDLREFEEAVTGGLENHNQVNVLFDLENMSGFTLDAAIEEIQFNRQHVGDYKRVAVVANDQWLVWFTWLTGVFAGADVQRFPTQASAEAWLE
ncbi:MAG: STAS/SEC14 domain-containing protein [Arenicellales bacterium]|jgi:hypothetical protein|nr:STAS/SEC14 domain-containing protein [Acidiferrobacteraceae bacterium]MDP6122637.1 STAS/SEC14 domain-containing protein [Arenicellales bacterium]MBT58707.1 STAS/SEC14 domain-containing protein [Acidiferrobacteraceae bacterium]MDP6289220.1 STAS/SEC14 domain-containing protein [Arenicellales bacterium]MDP6434821.1 STAS/SEC14 domain-containing protein [Arenicellales bacterium]|tara:strand:+ start:2508 stop:2849 length:342 start_codon:yes stop_codon:yes gene_type:complete